MNCRTILNPIAAAGVLALAGCSGAAVTSSAAPSASTVAKMTASASATPTASATVPKTCAPTRDVIVWLRIPGSPDSAQRLGNYYQRTCQTTFEWIKETAGTDAGDCTEAAWASDNPGYDENETPAKPLKKVQVKAGSGCPAGAAAG